MDGRTFRKRLGYTLILVLADFVYRTELGIGIFSSRGSARGVLLTVSARTLRAATTDPVHALRRQ
jgi:hypothetical protein